MILKKNDYEKNAILKKQLLHIALFASFSEMFLLVLENLYELPAIFKDNKVLS